MAISFDATGAERTAEAAAVFAELSSGSGEPVVLTTLSGADLCVLGWQEGPVAWEALARSWSRLTPEERSKIIESRAGQMLERGLLIAESPGQGYDALARYGTSAKLGIALAAQANPTFVITSAFSPKQAPLILFALGDATAPVRGIVMEVPSLIPGKEKETLEWGPLSWQFNHLLATVDFAAQYLTEWTIKSTPANALRKKAARTVALYRPGEEGTPAAELAVAGDGTSARVAGAGVSGEYDSAGLRAVLLDLFGQGGAAPRSALLSQAP
jgi:hypothetical protein